MQRSTAADGAADSGVPAFDHTAGHKVVNSLADPGNGICNATQCTLREAINDPGSTEISFTPGLTGPVTLASPAAGGGTLIIEKKLSITGPSTRIVIRPRSTNPDFGVFQIGGGGPVTLTNLTIRGGKASGGFGGGGINNGGTLRLVNSVVAGNSVDFGGDGGGIENRGGTLTLTNSVVASNSSTEGFGGGISTHREGSWGERSRSGTARSPATRPLAKAAASTTRTARSRSSTARSRATRRDRAAAAASSAPHSPPSHSRTA